MDDRTTKESTSWWRITIAIVICFLVVSGLQDPYDAAMDSIHEKAAGCSVFPERCKGQRLYVLLGEVAHSGVPLSEETVAELLRAAYGNCTQPLLPLVGQHGTSSHRDPVWACDARSSRDTLVTDACPLPPLLRALFIEGFSYSVSRETVDDEPALSIMGSLERPYHGDNELESDPVHLALVMRLDTLDDHRALFRATHPGLDHGSTLDKHEQEELVDSLLAAAWGRQCLWLEKHLAYAVVYLDGLEIRVHTYRRLDPEHHVIRYQEQIGISALCGHTHCEHLPHTKR